MQQQRTVIFAGRWRETWVGAVVAFIVFGLRVVASAEPGATQPAVKRPTTQASFANHPPLLTAEADDPAWRFVPTIEGLTAPLRTTTDDSALPTQIRLLWDKDFLYVRFTCSGKQPYAPFGDQHDAKHYQGDAVEVFIDPVGDGRQYFEIQLSPANGVLDQNTLITATPEVDEDGALVPHLLQTDYWPNIGYDMPGLRTASRVTGDGDAAVWTADLALPAAAVLHRLGKKQFEPMEVRMNLLRYRWTGPIDQPQRRLIPINWSPTRFGCPHQSAGAMGTVQLK